MSHPASGFRTIGALSLVLPLTPSPFGKPGAWPRLQEPSATCGCFGWLCSAFASPALGGRAGSVPRGSLVWWPGVWPRAGCSAPWAGMEQSHREHSRRRQGLINILNHLYFDLSPDSYSDAESWKLKTYFVKAPLADAVVKQGSLALRKGRSFRKESKRSKLIQKDKQCMSVCILGFTYEIQSW